MVGHYDHVTKEDYDRIAGPDWPSFVDFQRHADVPDFVYAEIDHMLTEPRSFDHPSFCVLPFYSWEYPLNTACCLLPKDHDLDSIKADMLAGVRPKDCAKCWNLEDRGIKSDRQLKNETLDSYLDRDIHDLLQDCLQDKNRRLHYKIDTSNTCNAACVTCDSNSSSSWAHLLNTNQQASHPNWQIRPDQVDHNIDYDSAQLIIFRGGEPLLSKTNFHVLEQLIKHNNTNCFVSFQTNGSVTPSPEQADLLSHFKNLNFSFSIDGVGPVFEYLRYPLKWNNILHNLDWCRQKGIDVSANYTVSNLNVFYHSQTRAWFEQTGLNYQTNLVYDPVWFRPSALPESVKDVIDFDFVNDPQDSEYYRVFRQKIQEQDTWKGISLKDYLPELAVLLG